MRVDTSIVSEQDGEEGPGPEISLGPGSDSVMWCHHCETWQLRSAMPTRVMRWDPDGGEVRSCVNCEDEPEGLGVWCMDDGGCACERLAAERQGRFYRGDCGCEK